MDDVKRINLWSGPRNVSTAVMYAFRERSDTSVVDEPLYAYQAIIDFGQLEIYRILFRRRQQLTANEQGQTYRQAN